MAKVAGSLWVDGTTLHYVDKNGNEWYFTGTDIGASAGIYGSIWIETNGTVRYVDNAGRQRSVAVIAGATRSGAIWGSKWVETTANTNYSLHGITNAAVEVAAHTDTHTDTSISHTDTHVDDSSQVHGDHQDVVGHGDAHVDGWDHSDAHDDTHGDTHADSGGGHGDTHSDGHSDFGDEGFRHFDHHTDAHTDGGGHSDAHEDTHFDEHGDYNHHDHSDSSLHIDTHADIAASHTDLHSDQPLSLGT